MFSLCSNAAGGQSGVGLLGIKLATCNGDSLLNHHFYTVVTAGNQVFGGCLKVSVIVRPMMGQAGNDDIGETRQRGRQNWPAKLCNVYHVPVIPANDADQRGQQDLVQRIGHHPRNPVVRHNPHMIQKTKSRGALLSRPFKSILVNRPLAI